MKVRIDAMTEIVYILETDLNAFGHEITVAESLYAEYQLALDNWLKVQNRLAPMFAMQQKRIDNP